MQTTVIVTLVVVLLVLVGWTAWRRFQKVARTDALARKPVLPVSPYPPSRGFKLLGAAEQPDDLSMPEAPRLEVEGELVFGDGIVQGESLFTEQHHSRDQWALERSMRRGVPFRLHRRRRSTTVVVSIVVAVVGLLVAIGLL